MSWRSLAHWQCASRSKALGIIGVRDPANAVRCFASKQRASKVYINRWSEEEDEKILQLRQKGKMPEDILEHLPGRSIAAIESRMYGPLRGKLLERGLIAEIQPRLSKNDIVRVRQLRSQGVPWRQLLREYPGRSVQAIKKRLRLVDEHRSSTQRRRRRNFEQWEDELLLRYRRDQSMRWPEISARMPHRSTDTLWNRYRLLVPSKERVFIPRSSVFTPVEVENLIHLRERGLPWAEVARRLGKTTSFGLRIRYLREKYFKDEEPRSGTWTKEEDQRLRFLSARGGEKWIEDAMQELNRSPAAINFRAWQLKATDARPSLPNSDSRRQTDASS